MKYTPRLSILLLSLVTLAPLSDASANTSLSQQLAHCAALGNDQKRLACYDELARSVVSSDSQAQGFEFIQPPASFLNSKLVAQAWKTEYTLTVRRFVGLISQAIMDNKQRVTVQGWSRDKHDYVLHITMRDPVNLHFLPRESGAEKISMSLLRDVNMDGHTISAGQFILIIAAMVPDERTSEGNAQRLPASK